MLDKEQVLVAKVVEIGEEFQVRRTQKPDLFKRVLKLEKSNGEVLFPEIRNQGLKMLDREGIMEGSLVQVEYVFQGSEKGGKRYNNVLISSIELYRKKEKVE